MNTAVLNEAQQADVAGEITVYNYDGDTREYLSTSTEYLAVGVGIPAHSCTDAPGESRSGYAICRTADLTAWEYVPDHRGETVYSTETGEPQEITAPGEYPDNTTTLPPSTEYDTWDGEKWVTDTEAQRSAAVAAAESQRQTRLSRAREQLVVGQTKLLCGRVLSEDEQTSLDAWLNYVDALNALDFTGITDKADVEAIEWPVVPGEEKSEM
ncbi:TPA: tail fiber assembly protein [Escherichia coli]|nr:tail fiber assembly protein [Escherichia coli]